MNDTRTTLHLQDNEIILIGTAHVSRESIEEVSRVIREEKPGMVCVELDSGRYAAMNEKDNWERLNVSRVIREGRGFFLMANLVLSGFQRRLGAGTGVKPGEEMKTAVETAVELNIPFAFCDRDVQITLRRAWARCGFWGRCKLMASLLSSAFTTEKLSEKEIEQLKSGSELDGMMAELAAYLPPVKETLIDERDQYLAAKIWASRKTKTVAVVGAGHMTGLKIHLERLAAGEAGEDVSALDRIPPKTLLSRAAGWAVPALIILLIVAGFFRAGTEVSAAMLIHWALLNGSLAALGALIALGHPLSILVSFIGAPVATINPFIGVGLFSGLTEAALRKPKVTDAQTISEDISSIKGIYRNRITRALLVFLLSTLGGAVGNFISIPSLIGQLFR
ncbi:MAG: TraB/GumN family protein [Treponema sp.]|jgi:pheromone shutdown-related protein TraB|nr:TraB/GumN family protein [Treponema sp.]